LPESLGGLRRDGWRLTVEMLLRTHGSRLAWCHSAIYPISNGKP
jgi:hypothetical protein